ncbi:MAG TPA: hydrogen gas-evolving membrane-bound hydrogenase subunit E [Candidatus Limnocylindria bacterium]|nr:hydrogen gas-evolving membrane-bound hydrogenase subunit E [Candidatus Limnocylindria bacterium]
MLLPLAVLLPFGAGAAIVVLGRAIDRSAGWMVLAAALGSTSVLARAALAGATGFTAAWMPSLGVTLALRADGFGFLLALLVAGIGVLVVAYSLAYLADAEPPRARRYYAALAAFMGAMLGIALADDLILLFVFWEITSVTSFLLIGYHAEDEKARAGALTALQVTALGGLAMMVGFLVMGQVAGTFRLSHIAADPRAVMAFTGSAPGSAALLLVLAGAFTKSAQVPFHFWLPRAMVAPTPVSAYLHAATMVKAGVFLLGRLHPVFGAAPLWAPLLVGVGTASMLLGAYQAVRETDLKAVLARMTASTLGLITLLYGLGATGADSLALLSHALYKGALFLVVGIVDHHAHTRSLDALGGLRRALPVTFVACAIASLSMAGVPPLLGFVAKEELLGTLLHDDVLHGRPLFQGLLVLAVVLTSACTVLVAGKLTLGVFLGPERPSRSAGRHGGERALWPAPLLLALGTLALGLASATPFTRAVVVGTASHYTGPVHVALVPEVGPAFAVSLVSLLLGAALYAGRERLRALQDRLARLPPASVTWDALMAGIVRLAEAYSRRWQNGSLRWYLAATALTLPALCLPALRVGGLSWANVVASGSDLPWYGLLLCVLLAVATLAAVRAETRLAATIAMTAIGFLVSMLFMVYRSPDILLTQILIETVATIFVLLVLAFLPRFKKQDLAPLARFVHVGVSAAFGLTITLLLLLAMTPGLRQPHNIATEPGGLLSLALAEGGGQNAVNVIIVDIRATDTTGEITVLVVVGLCIYGLLRSRRRATRGEPA